METALFINNRDVPAADGGRFERRNPLTGAVVTRAAAATAHDARVAADTAAAAFPSWAAVRPSERRILLLAAADLLAARARDFTDVMAGETGAAEPWVNFNVMLAANMLREVASFVTQINGQVHTSEIPGCLSMSIRQPVGVVLGIAPWNAPIILAVRAIAAPLACGNTVILKASEISPGTQLALGHVFKDAGFPAGVVNVISNAPADAADVVETLIAHPAVRRINFTGSTRVGRIIAETAGRHLKPVLLELGGKAPLVVLDDADLDQAVNAAAFGAFMYQGQICMSTERVVVDQKVADAFVAKFAAKALALPAGDPRNGNVVLGPLIGEDAAERVESLIEEAVAKGAKLAAGGQRDGCIMAATVLDHVTAEMRIYHEESFGPVAPVIRVRDVKDAIRIANDTDYGLSAAVYGRDVNRALAVAKQIESGICHINGPTVQDEAQIPFGGMKASGYGRFGGHAAINEFTELRWITVETEPHQYPF
jgi:acyl-CoA reductase-like NAD-dependent aldehyde dehydrogenase